MRIQVQMITVAPRQTRNLAKALLFGLLGGFAGSLAKDLGEKVYPPRTQGQTPPPVVLERKLIGRPLSQSQENAGAQVIHYVFGGGSGALYGFAAEFAPIVTVGYGSAFGVVLQLLTHETLVPAAGLDAPAPRQPLREHTSELFTHVLYGVVTEAVRRFLRRRYS